VQTLKFDKNFSNFFIAILLFLPTYFQLYDFLQKIIRVKKKPNFKCSTDTLSFPFIHFNTRTLHKKYLLKHKVMFLIIIKPIFPQIINMPYRQDRKRQRQRQKKHLNTKHHTLQLKKIEYFFVFSDFAKP